MTKTPMENTMSNTIPVTTSEPIIPVYKPSLERHDSDLRFYFCQLLVQFLFAFGECLRGFVQALYLLLGHGMVCLQLLHVVGSQDIRPETDDGDQSEGYKDRNVVFLAIPRSNGSRTGGRVHRRSFGRRE